MVLNRNEKGKLTEVYNQVYLELKERYPIEIPIMNFNNILKKSLSKNKKYSRENLNYLRGYFRKNKVLIYNHSTGHLKWA